MWGWVLGLIVVEVQGRLLRGDLFASSPAVQVTRTELVVAGLGALLALEVAPTAWRGRTLGKALLGLRVVPVADPTRLGIGWPAATARSLALLGPFVVPSVGWILPVAALAVTAVSAGGRGPHDRLAATIVVDAASPVAGTGVGPRPRRDGRLRFPAAAMAPLPLDEATVTTLVEVGLPVDVPGAFRVDRRMAVFDERLFRVGLDPSGRSLCVASPGGEVVAIDEQGVLAPLFAGTTLARFVAGLEALDQRDPAGVRAVLAEVDPDALVDPDSWWREVLAVP